MRAYAISPAMYGRMLRIQERLDWEKKHDWELIFPVHTQEKFSVRSVILSVLLGPLR